MNYLTLREANIARQREWDPDGHASYMVWRLNELGGEVGEVCNVLKKLHRERTGVPGSRATKDQLAEELADVMICIDLTAMTAGMDAFDVISLTMPGYLSLPQYGVKLLKFVGRACGSSTDCRSFLMLLQETIRNLATREEIDLDMAVAAKFNATSAKMGLATTLRAA